MSTRPGAGDRNPAHGASRLFQFFGEVTDGSVLGLGCDQGAAGRACGDRTQHAPDGQVDGLGAAGGEGDFAGLDADEVGEGLAGEFNLLA